MEQYLITDDVLPAVFSYLNWKDIIYTQQVCKQWKEAACRAIIPSTSMLPIIFGYLDWKDILCVRGTCTQWCEAAKHTLVPPSIDKRAFQGAPRHGGLEKIPQFNVNTSRAYNMLDVMRKVMPNLQQIQLSKFQGIEPIGFMIPLMGDVNGPVARYDEDVEERYLEGEDAEESLKYIEDWRTYDVSIIADFVNLRSLIINDAPLHGKYPCLFGFKHLRELSISQGADYCDLKWDLKMLKSMPLIEKLYLSWSGATGSISDLHFLKNTLKHLTIVSSVNAGDAKIGGNFMDLTEFVLLETIILRWATEIYGDVSDIQESDFPRVKKLVLPGVLHRIEQSSDVIDLFTSFARRSPPCIASVRLAENAPDHYRKDGRHNYCPPPPFTLEFVKASSRLGWRWKAYPRFGGRNSSCEINWLDEEPDSSHSIIERRAYQKEAKRLGSSVGFYRGVHNLPSKEDYQGLCIAHEERELQSRRESMRRFREAMVPRI